MQVSLGYPDRRMMQVHRLVLTAFVGPCPDGLECCHWDDNPAHNCLGNLRWDTRSANQVDRIRNGRNPDANKTHCDRGHAFDEVNTYTNPKTGKRYCRPCIRDAQRHWRETHLEEQRRYHREWNRAHK